MSASPGRLAAARALLAIEDGTHLEDALARLAPATGADRDLAWFLAFGVQRRRGHVDAALRPLLHQPLAALDPEVRAALRIGAFERLYARTAPHAAVHQAVEVVRKLGAGRAHGMVNAVLRRVKMPERLGEADALDHPAWLVARWRQRYGDAAARAWCEANAEPPPLFVVTRDPAGGGPVPEGASPASVAGVPLPGVYRLDAAGGTIPGLRGFAEGAWWVQDAASVAVADQVPAGEGARVLDACAAPGGKAFRLASRGARVLAVDRSADRLVSVTEGAARLGLPVEVRAHDWTEGPIDGLGTFDAVLVDAPCSGLGTVRRHPEIRWRRQEPDLVGAAATQERILAAASAHVAPGGALVYAVCSPEPEEGPEVVERFLAAHDAFEQVGGLSTAPPADGEDAHFVAVMRRRR